MSTLTLEPPVKENRVAGVDHFSSAAERERQVQLQPEQSTLPLGPLKVVHAFWLAGMSCDGCSIAAVGATAPSVEDLLSGTIPGVPRVVIAFSRWSRGKNSSATTKWQKRTSWARPTL